MFKAITQSNGFAAILFAAVACGSLMPLSSASASELYDIVVVPAEDDHELIAAAVIEPAAYPAKYEASFRRIQPTSASGRMASRESRLSARPERTKFAWPYTARTISVK